MNIAFLLTPKKEVAYLPLKCTMRQALEKMEHHGYAAVPLIDDKGKYAGTVTEGDLLWKLKNTPGLTIEGTEKIMLQSIIKKDRNEPVRIGAKVQDVLLLAVEQNFVPVIDDEGIFIGIVRRRAIIEYYVDAILSNEELIKPGFGINIKNSNWSG